MKHDVLSPEHQLIRSEDSYEEALKPAKGIMLGMVGGLALWAVLLGALKALL